MVALLITAAASAVVLIVLVVSAIPFSSDILRRRMIATLSEHLESQVELDGLTLRVLPQFHAEGIGLRIRHRGRTDVPPLIKIDRISVDASIGSLIRKHVLATDLAGLEINIPPGDDSGRDDGAAGERPDRVPDVNLKGGAARDMVVDMLTANDARLVIISNKKDKSSKVWTIHHLSMQSVSFAQAMPFQATLTNAVPPGEIQTTGSFGPWQSGRPGATPLEGVFTFAKADLSVFKGISGILSAHGEFGGTLGRIGVHGETNVPQFTVSVSGHPVPLHADYHTTVDGTNGDTILDRIDATFLNTSLVAKGRVVSTPGQKGRTVALDVAMNKARIEDVLRLAIKSSKSPMTGAMTLETKFVLPPGDRDVVEKLRLDGHFGIATVKFTDIDIQKKIDVLSRRSRGQTEDTGESSVVSDFSGRFKLADGMLSLSTLTFRTPGTAVHLAGRYALRPETLDFKGTLLMDAKISETQKGWKRLALKALDPLFAKKGGGDGSEIPIKIQGERSHPSFGLDTHGLLRRDR